MPPLVVRMLNRVNWFYFVVKRAVETKNVNFFFKILIFGVYCIAFHMAFYFKRTLVKERFCALKCAINAYI